MEIPFQASDLSHFSIFIKKLRTFGDFKIPKIFKIRNFWFFPSEIVEIACSFSSKPYQTDFSDFFPKALGTKEVEV